jgi:hypothetical protein
MKPRQYNDDELEQLLKESLQPKKPSWDSDRKVLEAFLLKDEKSVRRSERNEMIRYSWIASLGIVAAIVLSFVYFIQMDSSDLNRANDSAQRQSDMTDSALVVAPLKYQAVGSKNRLVGVEDLGWKQVDDENVSREYRYDYVDTVDLINEKDGSIIRLQVPRQEIINVTYQVI